jgi:hypothetical protein
MVTKVTKNHLPTGGGAMTTETIAIVTAAAKEETGTQIKAVELPVFPIQSPKEDTSIIIVSCLTPSAPDISMIDMLYDSLVMLEGLSQTAPIIIAIDNLVEEGSFYAVKHNYASSTVENKERLEEYAQNLRLRFKDDKRVTVLPYVAWQMHNHVIKKALQLVDTKFVYVLQYDEVFKESVNHTAIVKTMEEHPDVLRKVEFNRGNNIDCNASYWFRGELSCKEDEVSYVNKPSFTKTCGWSDQCHFTTKEDYKEVLAIIGDRKIHPEFVMNRRAYSKKNCKHWGAHFYGNLTEGPFIQHVNGRFIN